MNTSIFYYNPKEHIPPKKDEVIPIESTLLKLNKNFKTMVQQENFENLVDEYTWEIELSY